MSKIPKDVNEKFEELSARVKKAYDQLPPEAQAQAGRVIDASHAAALRGTGKGGLEMESVGGGPAPHQLSLVRSALEGKTLSDIVEGPEGEEGAEAEAGDAEAGLAEIAVTPPIGPGGEIWWFEKYQQLDPGWVESAIVWMSNHNNKVSPFPTDAATITIPDETTIAVVGDWGTGNYGDSPAPSQQVIAALAKLNPDYAIHLGDVYYGGTSEEETEKFLDCWGTPGSAGSFTLNSNHEMMDGGHGYFNTLLTDSRFSQQNGTSFFALENSNWVIIGLDSSYYASWDDMYGAGNLDAEVQLPFLKKTAAAANEAGKSVMVMCHQNGLNSDGTATTALWNQVAANLPAGATSYWYWGHEHIGVVYPAQQGIVPRCSGHGAIPQGFASALEDSKNDGKVVWFEKGESPDVSYEVMNGFTLLTFNGNKLMEQFFAQDGTQSWPST